MSKSRPPYPPEFRRQILDLVRAGRTPEELAREYEPTATTIRNWVTQDDVDAGRRTDGLTSEERAELTKLRRDNRVLREERVSMNAMHRWSRYTTLDGAVPATMRQKMHGPTSHPWVHLPGVAAQPRAAGRSVPPSPNG